MNDVAGFRKYPQWGALISWVKRNLKVPARQTLSAHTTSACQPNKATGPSAGSLNTSGLDTFLSAVGEIPPPPPSAPSPADGGLPSGFQPSVSGNLYLNVELPDAFVHGDGLGVKYVSKLIYLWSTDQKPLQQRKKELQEQSCLELLCYLVVSAPARVRLHPSCFIGGKEKV